MDLLGATIEFDCPECGFLNATTLGDVVNGSSLICVGCLKTIQLSDDGGGTKRAIDEVDQAFNELGKVFKHGH